MLFKISNLDEKQTQEVFFPLSNHLLSLNPQVLSIIQTWADAFRSQPDLAGVVHVYNDLRSKSIDFPEKFDCQVPPIHTPQRSVPVQPPANHQLSLYQQAVGLNPSQNPPFQLFHPHPNSARMAAAGPIVLNEEQLAKLKSEIDIVNGNIKVFDEMLTELDKANNRRPEDLELLHELNATCLQMQKRIVDLLDKISNEEVTSELLTVNDNLNNLFTRYEPFSVKNSAGNAQPTAQQRPNNSNLAGSLAIAANPANPSVKPKVNTEASLIDLGESKDGGAKLASQLEGLALGGSGPISPNNKQLMSVDSRMAEQQQQPRARPQPSNAAAAASGDTDFDEFAQLRSEKRLIDGVELPNEQEVTEMEMWLKEQNSSEPPASLSNTEFDKFLEQRFSNLEKNQPPKKPSDNKSSDDLLDL